MGYEYDSVRERCEQCALYIIENRATVRKTAEVFGISKSTVHKDVTERLRAYKPQLCLRVYEVLKVNKEERHLRGGEATRKKYLGMKET